YKTLITATLCLCPDLTLLPRLSWQNNRAAQMYYRHGGQYVKYYFHARKDRRVLCSNEGQPSMCFLTIPIAARPAPRRKNVPGTGTGLTGFLNCPKLRRLQASSSFRSKLMRDSVEVRPG